MLNTLSGSALCTVAFSAITAVFCFFLSLPRPLSQLSTLGTFSAATMGIAVLLAIVFAGVQDHPFGYVAGDEPIVHLFAPKGTTYVAGMSAFLNILYTFVGQITLPSFIAEMKNPRDFPKGAPRRVHACTRSCMLTAPPRTALWAVTIAEIVTFTLCGALMYHWVGNQYITAPAVGSLQETYKKIAFAFAIPTIVFLGALYASVSARFVFFRIFRNSKHLHSNTVVGWATWVAILAATWVLAFIIAEVRVPTRCSACLGWSATANGSV